MDCIATGNAHGCRGHGERELQGIRRRPDRLGRKSSPSALVPPGPPETDSGSVSVGLLAKGGSKTVATVQGLVQAKTLPGTRISAAELDVLTAANMYAMPMPPAFAGGIIKHEQLRRPSPWCPLRCARDRRRLGGQRHRHGQGPRRLQCPRRVGDPRQPPGAWSPWARCDSTVSETGTVNAVFGAAAHVTGTSVEVRAQHNNPAHVTTASSPRMATPCSQGLDWISLPTTTALTTGDQVIYQAGGGTPIAAWWTGRPTKPSSSARMWLRLGSTFSAPMSGPTRTPFASTTRMDL